MTNHPNRGKNSGGKVPYICSCTDGFHEPSKDCAACGGIGFIYQESAKDTREWVDPNKTVGELMDDRSSAWQRRLHDHAVKQLSSAVSILGHEEVFRRIADGLDASARGTPNTVLASNYQHMATHLRGLTPDLRALKL